MSHSFQIIIPCGRDVVDVLVDAKLKVRDVNGFIDGDVKSGEFGVKGVEGNYSIYGDTILITLHKKPFFVTFSYIEKQVKLFFT